MYGFLLPSDDLNKMEVNDELSSSFEYSCSNAGIDWSRALSALDLSITKNSGFCSNEFALLDIKSFCSEKDNKPSDLNKSSSQSKKENDYLLNSFPPHIGLINSLIQKNIDKERITESSKNNQLETSIIKIKHSLQEEIQKNIKLSEDIFNLQLQLKSSKETSTKKDEQLMVLQQQLFDIRKNKHPEIIRETKAPFLLKYLTLQSFKPFLLQNSSIFEEKRKLRCIHSCLNTLLHEKQEKKLYLNFSFNFTYKKNQINNFHEFVGISVSSYIPESIGYKNSEKEKNIDLVFQRESIILHRKEDIKKKCVEKVELSAYNESLKLDDNMSKFQLFNTPACTLDKKLPTSSSNNKISSESHLPLLPTLESQVTTKNIVFGQFEQHLFILSSQDKLTILRETYMRKTEEERLLFPKIRVANFELDSHLENIFDASSAALLRTVCTKKTLVEEFWKVQAVSASHRLQSLRSWARKPLQTLQALIFAEYEKLRGLQYKHRILFELLNQREDIKELIDKETKKSFNDLNFAQFLTKIGRSWRALLKQIEFQSQKTDNITFKNCKVQFLVQLDKEELKFYLDWMKSCASFLKILK